MAKIDTELAVVDALDRLMVSTPLDRVRVTALCKAAGISRARFYELFDNIYAVATWAWDHLMYQSLYQMGATLNPYDAHLLKFTLLRENRRFFRNAMAAQGYESVNMHGGRVMQGLITERFTRKAHRAPTESERLQIEFYNTGATYVTKQWVERAMKEEPADMARLFTSNLPAFVLPYLEPDSV